MKDLLHGQWMAHLETLTAEVPGQELPAVALSQKTAWLSGASAVWRALRVCGRVEQELGLEEARKLSNEIEAELMRMNRELRRVIAERAKGARID